MANYDVQENYSADSKENFDIDEMQRFIIRRGAKVYWEKSYICTCRSESGYPLADCPICHGTGFSFLPPIETQVMLQSMGRGIANTPEGLSMTGTALGTTTLEESNRIGFRDRITFSDKLIPESIMIKVTPKHITHGIYLRYHVEEITSAILGYPNPANLDVTTLKLDKDKDILYPTKDMVGKYLSLNVRVYLRFYVVDYLREGRYQYANDPRTTTASEQFKDLPALMLLRREDMYVPAILNNAGESTSVDSQPKVTLDDNSLGGGFFSHES